MFMKKEEKISIFEFDDNGTLSRKEILNELKEFQKIVEGYIEPIHLINNVYLIVNEEGKLKDLDFSLMIEMEDLKRFIVQGNCFITKIEDEEFASLSEADFKILNSNLKFLKDSKIWKLKI